MSDTKGYIVGDWNAYCDYCEGQYLASELKTDYWGFKACPKDFTKPNPQMFVRVTPEKIVVPWSRSIDGASAYSVSPILLASGATDTTSITSDPTLNIFTFSTDSASPGARTVTLPDPTAFPEGIYPVYVISHIDSANGLNNQNLLTFTVAGGSTIRGNSPLNAGQKAYFQVVKLRIAGSFSAWWTRVE